MTSAEPGGLRPARSPYRFVAQDGSVLHRVTVFRESSDSAWVERFADRVQQLICPQEFEQSVVDDPHRCAVPWALLVAHVSDDEIAELEELLNR